MSKKEIKELVNIVMKEIGDITDSVGFDLGISEKKGEILVDNFSNNRIRFSVKKKDGK